MQLRVNEVNQAASGGSYVCIFDAEVDLDSSGEVRVVVEAVEPPETQAEFIESARVAIRAGALHALEAKGIGASIRITRLVVHLVDFKPSRFTLYAAREMKKLLGDDCFQHGPRDQTPE
jgi:hypothetical protein